MLFLASSFDTDVSIQSSIGILLLSLSLALIIVGVIILKLRILDAHFRNASRIVGSVMIAAGALLLLASIFGLIHVNFFMNG